MSLRYLIDTDWAIHYLNGHPAIVARLNGVKTDGLALSVISLAELYEGVYYSKNPQGNEVTLNNFLQGVEVIGIDEEASRRFGKERGRLRSAGKTTGDFDLLIGVTAVQQNLTLLTNNRRHFEVIDGLSLESL